MPRNKQKNKNRKPAVQKEAAAAIAQNVEPHAEEKRDRVWAEGMLAQEKVQAVWNEYFVPILQEVQEIEEWAHYTPPEYHSDENEEESSEESQKILARLTEAREICVSRDTYLKVFSQCLQKIQKACWEEINEMIPEKENGKLQLSHELTMGSIDASLVRSKIWNDLSNVVCMTASFKRKYTMKWIEETPLEMRVTTGKLFFKGVEDILTHMEQICREMKASPYGGGLLKTVTQETSLVMDTCLVQLREYIPMGAYILLFNSKKIITLQKNCVLHIQRFREGLAHFFPAPAQPAGATILSDFIVSIFALQNPKAKKIQTVQQNNLEQNAPVNPGRKRAQAALQKKYKACEDPEKGQLFVSKRDEQEALEKIKRALFLAAQLEEQITTITPYDTNDMAVVLFKLLDILTTYETYAGYDLTHAQRCTQEGFHSLLNIALFFLRFCSKRGMETAINNEKKTVVLKTLHDYFFQKHTDAFAEIAADRAAADANLEWLLQQHEIHETLSQQAVDTGQTDAWSENAQGTCRVPTYLMYRAESAAAEVAQGAAEEVAQGPEMVWESQVYGEIVSCMEAGEYEKASVHCQNAFSAAAEENVLLRLDCLCNAIEVALIQLKKELQKKLFVDEEKEASKKKPSVALSFPLLESVHHAMMQHYELFEALLKKCEGEHQKEKRTHILEPNMLRHMLRTKEIFFERIADVTKHMKNKEDLRNARFTFLHLGYGKVKEKLGPRLKQNKSSEEYSPLTRERHALQSQIASPEAARYARYLRKEKNVHLVAYAEQKTRIPQDLVFEAPVQAGEEKSNPLQSATAKKSMLPATASPPSGVSSRSVGNGPGFFESSPVFHVPENAVQHTDCFFLLPPEIQEMVMTFVKKEAKEEEREEEGWCVALSGGALLHGLLPDDYPDPLDVDFSTNLTPETIREKCAHSRMMSSPLQVEVDGQVLSTTQIIGTEKWAEVAHYPNLPLDEGNPPTDLCKALVAHAKKHADFTVNAIYLIYTKAGGFYLFDAAHNKILKTREEFEAIPEIKNKILRITGSLDRIEEDPILILRALKMICGKGYRLEENGDLQKRIQDKGARALRRVLHDAVSPEEKKKREHILHYFNTKLRPLLKHLQQTRPLAYQQAQRLLETLNLSQVVTPDGLEEKPPGGADGLSALARLSFKATIGDALCTPAETFVSCAS